MLVVRRKKVDENNVCQKENNSQNNVDGHTEKRNKTTLEVEGNIRTAKLSRWKQLGRKTTTRLGCHR